MRRKHKERLIKLNSGKTKNILADTIHNNIKILKIQIISLQADKNMRHLNTNNNWNGRKRNNKNYSENHIKRAKAKKEAEHVHVH